MYEVKLYGNIARKYFHVIRDIDDWLIVPMNEFDVNIKKAKYTNGFDTNVYCYNYTTNKEKYEDCETIKITVQECIILEFENESDAFYFKLKYAN